MLVSCPHPPNSTIFSTSFRGSGFRLRSMIYLLLIIIFVCVCIMLQTRVVSSICMQLSGFLSTICCICWFFLMSLVCSSILRMFISMLIREINPLLHCFFFIYFVIGIMLTLWKKLRCTPFFLFYRICRDLGFSSSFKVYLVEFYIDYILTKTTF